MSDDVIHGEPVTAEEAAELAAFLTVFDPKPTLDRLDAYGKWLFASSATIGALGVGLSNTSFSTLRGPGVWLFAGALLALGCCLIAASLSLAPHWDEAYRTDLGSLRRVVARQFADRRWRLRIATIAFALALGLAALAPLVSALTERPESTIHYTIDDKGVLVGAFQADGIDRGVVVEFRLESSSGTVLSTTASMPDAGGRIRLTLPVPTFASFQGSLALAACARPATQMPCSILERAVVR